MTVEPTPILPPPFTYQEYQIGKIYTLGHTGIISPPGSGKTRVPIEGLARLGLVSATTGVTKPVLVVCTGPAIGTWKWQFPYWLGCSDLTQQIYVVQGKPEHRRRLWDLAAKGMEGIYITNNALFHRDFQYIMGKGKKPGDHWAALICDEYHKYMRRRKSETFKRIATIARNIDVVAPTSGSSLGRDPTSLWTLFHLCDPDHPLFRGFWKFANTFCVMDDESSYGRQFITARNVDKLRELMDHYLGYVPREVVADQLPGGNRRRLEVEMTPQQEKAYHKIRKEMILELQDGSGLVVAPTVLSKLTIMRKLLCMPKMVDPGLDWGGGFEAIGERLEDQPHVVIFVPFRDACDWVQRGLMERFGYQSRILRGQISTEEQHEHIRWFKQAKGIIVCTIAYAESFDLETCDTSYFLGYSHLDQNQQAEGRTQRAISEFDSVWWHYIMHIDTIDEDLLEDLNQVHETARKVLQRPEEMLRMLRGSK